MTPVESDQHRLRDAAETRLSREPRVDLSRPDLPSLVHELRVHQIELEMQNEELRRSQAELDEARRSYVELYDFAPVGYLQLDPRSSILGANLTIGRLLGVDRQSLMGRPLPAFLDAADADRWHIARKSLLEKGESHSLRVTMRRGDGGTFVAQMECERRERGPAGAQIWVALTDVTEQKRVEQQLAVAARLSALGTLVAGVGHEINNPLAAMMASEGFVLDVVRDLLGQLRSGSPPPAGKVAAELDETLEPLEDGLSSGRRIAQIVKDLAVFGEAWAVREVVPLHAVVASAIRWLPASVGSMTHVEVMDQGAPPVMGLPGQLSQVVLNLVANAFRAGREGTPSKVTVRLRTGQAGTAVVEVEDDGIGMTPELMQRIFDPFFTTRASGDRRGAGLGLSICQSIVAAHGGKIGVKSEPGKGSTFTVELPAAAGPGNDQPLAGTPGRG